MREGAVDELQEELHAQAHKPRALPPTSQKGEFGLITRIKSSIPATASSIMRFSLAFYACGDVLILTLSTTEDPPSLTHQSLPTMWRLSPRVCICLVCVAPYFMGPVRALYSTLVHAWIFQRLKDAHTKKWSKDPPTSTTPDSSTLTPSQTSNSQGSDSSTFECSQKSSQNSLHTSIKRISPSSSAKVNEAKVSPARRASFSIEIPSPPTPTFLLLCVPQNKYGTRLVHMGLQDVITDKKLFTEIRSHYLQLRGRWLGLLSLRKLRSIEFARFEAYKSELVDIRKVPDIPPEDRTEDYLYAPRPAEYIPPVGNNHLLHLYDHPDHAEDDPVCQGKFPKKLHQRLAVSREAGTTLGWGIHFVEGLH